MKTYPFDSQHCFLQLSGKYNTRALVRLVPGTIDLLGDKDLLQYFIKNISVYPASLFHNDTLKHDITIEVQCTLKESSLKLYLTLFSYCSWFWAEGY